MHVLIVRERRGERGENEVFRLHMLHRKAKAGKVLEESQSGRTVERERGNGRDEVSSRGQGLV